MSKRIPRHEPNHADPVGVEKTWPTTPVAAQLPRLEPLDSVRTAVLDISYFDAGPRDGEVVILLHGYPYDIHSYAEVVPRLTGEGLRVIVPYLRGHGPTQFVSPDTPRSGQQAAIGADVIALLDALEIPRAILAGYDWGARAACVVAALWPERCVGLVSVNSYAIQDITSARRPSGPELEATRWYLFYFATERGRAGLATNRRGIARVIWRRNSPWWRFAEATLDRAAVAFDNEDYVDVVVHAHRHQLGLAPGDPAYSDLERRLATLPPISVPAVTLDGLADGSFPAQEAGASATHFTGPRSHRHVAHAGHNLPQQAPEAFARAILEVRGLRLRVLQDGA